MQVSVEYEDCILCSAQNIQGASSFDIVEAVQRVVNVTRLTSNFTMLDVDLTSAILTAVANATRTVEFDANSTGIVSHTSVALILYVIAGSYKTIQYVE